MNTRTPSWRTLTLPVTFALACVLLTAGLFHAFGGSLPLTPQSYRARIPLPAAANLVAGSGVQIAGVKIGRVVDVTRAGNAAVATVELQPRFAPLRADAVAIARTKTLLGEGYIELAPGSRTAPPIREGGELLANNVRAAVQLDEFLQTFGPRTRRQMQALFAGLATAFQARSQALNDTLGDAAPFSDNLDLLLASLRQQRSDLGRMVASAGYVLDAVGRRQGALRAAISAGNSALDATARRDAALEATFRSLPPFLRQLRSTSDRISADSPDLVAAVRALDGVAPLLAPALQAIDRTAPEFRGLFQELPATLGAGARSVPSLTSIIRATQRGLRGFYPTSRELVPFMKLMAVNRLSLVFAPANLGAIAPGTMVGPGGRVLSTTTGIATVWNETFSGWTHRLPTNRMNPYPVPPYGLLDTAKMGFIKSYDCRNVNNPLYLPPTGSGAPPCVLQGPWTFDGKSAYYPRLQLAPR